MHPTKHKQTIPDSATSPTHLNSIETHKFAISNGFLSVVVEGEGRHAVVPGSRLPSETSHKCKLGWSGHPTFVVETMRFAAAMVHGCV
eukprot:1539168-Amphidinium_carterae.1